MTSVFLHIVVKYTVASELSRHTHTHSSALFFNYLHSGVGVLFDPFDDRLIDQLLSLCVETVVGQISHQVLLGHT